MSKKRNFDSVGPNGDRYNDARRIARDLRKSQTIHEEMFWRSVKNGKIDGLRFYRQRPFFAADIASQKFYVADFYCHELRLVIEIDGPIHKSQNEADEIRTEILNSLGPVVLRLSNEDIELNMPSVLTRTRRFAEEVRSGKATRRGD